LAIKLLMNSIPNYCEFNWHCAVIRFVPHIFGLLLSMLTDLNLVWGGDWTRDRDLVFPNVFIFLLQVTTQLTGYPWGKGKWHWIFFWWPLFNLKLKPFLLCFWVYLTVAILLRGVSKNPVALRIRLGADVSVSVLHFVVYSNIR
jgi:hypothetical protein